MKWYYLILGFLAVWRITHLFQAEDGPFDVIFRIRKSLGTSVVGKMMDCFNCLSIWIAMPFAYFIGSSWAERILLWLALSGAAILLERLTSRNDHPDKCKQYYKEE